VAIGVAIHEEGQSHWFKISMTVGPCINIELEAGAEDETASWACAELAHTHDCIEVSRRGKGGSAAVLADNGDNRQVRKFDFWILLCETDDTVRSVVPEPSEGRRSCHDHPAPVYYTAPLRACLSPVRDVSAQQIRPGRNGTARSG
jgi:hypothetical protein